MDPLWLALFGLALGAALLVLEIFVPSHGLLSVAGLALVGAGVYGCFRISAPAGYGALAFSIVVVPSISLAGLKIFRRTAIGRMVAPPNPVLTSADVGVELDVLRSLVGESGRAVSPLRPVGTCEFAGRRIQCVAECGLVEAGAAVLAIGISGAALSVRPLDGSAAS